MDGGSEEDGFALETEVGLFAMKRDQVYRALKPFEDAGIEVDIVQLTPLTIYNFTVFDQMQDLPPADQYDPDNPPESVVVLSLGTDTTDLVITNGYRVWQRSIPLGGSHFTKALTKELRLTFAKAEHLKKNATQAEDPKAVFQAMRPVFNDLLTEIQRSIGYFTSIDREAKIGRVIALGNAMRLPGLQKYLSQNLGHNVAEVQSYRGLIGPDGGRRAGLQGQPAELRRLLRAGAARAWASRSLSTNLLPPEIVTDRLIRDKKPWAVAMVAALLLGMHDQLLWTLAGLELSPPRSIPAGHGAGRRHHEPGRHRRSSEYEAEKQKFTDDQRHRRRHWWATSTGDCCGRKCSRPLTNACPPIPMTHVPKRSASATRFTSRAWSANGSPNFRVGTARAISEKIAEVRNQKEFRRCRWRLLPRRPPMARRQIRPPRPLQAPTDGEVPPGGDPMAPHRRIRWPLRRPLPIRGHRGRAG